MSLKVEKFSLKSSNLEGTSYKIVTMIINNYIKCNFLVDKYMKDFIENVLIETNGWNLPTPYLPGKGSIEMLLEKDKIKLTTMMTIITFENNDVVKREMERFFKEELT